MRIVLLALALAMPAAAAAAERAANAIFLVAARDLNDPNFRQTVVLVTHPQEGGPWGVIINRPLQRRGAPDRVFSTSAAKWEALVRRIGALHAKGRPVLIGTRSVAASEHQHPSRPPKAQE